MAGAFSLTVINSAGGVPRRCPPRAKELEALDWKGTGTPKAHFGLHPETARRPPPPR